MELPKNRVKAAMRDGRVQTGLWLSLAHPAVAEIAGRAGFDWCLIDGEHAPNTLTTLQAQLLALEAAGCPAVVRVASGDPVRLKQVLDLGAQSVLVPLVNTAEEAAAVVSACRYAPAGTRGNGGATMRAGQWGAIPDYVRSANHEVCVMVQAETRTAMAAIPEIAGVPGVDCVFIGPADLASDMGHPGAIGHPAVRKAIEEGIAGIRAAGKAAGIIGFASEDIEAFARMGADFLAVGADAPVLSRALRDLARSAAAVLADGS